MKFQPMTKFAGETGDLGPYRTGLTIPAHGTMHVKLNNTNRTGRHIDAIAITP